ncbi:hypothetical protein MHU86_9621 (mitochondrion) [Fragilaria crotonensis]|nr:hypothetical protein MHU86_9621 [Fragilaria crotonensis]
MKVFKNINTSNLILPIIFIFLIDFLVIFYFYFYLYHDQVICLAAELDSLKEKNQQLQGAIAEALKKLEVAEQGKNKSLFSSIAGDGSGSSISPYVKYLCVCACAVVVIIVCAKVWPAPFVAIKTGISAYIQNFKEFPDRYCEFATTAYDGTDYDWLVTISKKNVAIFIKLSDDPDTHYTSVIEVIHLMEKTIRTAPANMPTLINIVDTTATVASQVPPIL